MVIKSWKDSFWYHFLYFVARGFWNLEMWGWNRGSGIVRLRFGIWNLEFEPATWTLSLDVMLQYWVLTWSLRSWLLELFSQMSPEFRISNLNLEFRNLQPRIYRRRRRKYLWSLIYMKCTSDCRTWRFINRPDYVLPLFISYRRIIIWYIHRRARRRDLIVSK
jgi:hypothetical protein